jgi:hypothetical protein
MMPGKKSMAALLRRDVRFSLCLPCLILGIAGINSLAQNPLAAGIPSGKKIEALLSSGDPRLVAWGAHYALASKDQTLIPHMLSLAEEWEPLPVPTEGDSSAAGLTSIQLDQRDALAAVLDTLIQLNAVVPASALRNLAGDFPNQVAIFLTRLPPEDSQALELEFYHSDPKTHGERNLQYMGGALLAQAPPPGFAADVLSSIHGRATITITSPTFKAEALYRGGESGSCFPDDTHKDWPRFGVYELSEGKMQGGFVLIPGTDPVYALRSETNHYRGNRCENFTFLVLGPEQRRSLIARMLAISQDDIEWKIETTDTIQFNSNEQFYRELQEFISAEQQKYRETASALVGKNLMTDSEQEESLPQLDLAFNDQRGPGYSPIPLPPSLPAHVTWPDQR